MSAEFESDSDSSPRAPAEPALVTHAYDLLLWLIQHVGKFPRSHRFVLGERIETTMLSVLMLLVEAAYTGEKLHGHDNSSQKKVVNV